MWRVSSSIHEGHELSPKLQSPSTPETDEFSRGSFNCLLLCDVVTAAPTEPAPAAEAAPAEADVATIDLRIGKIIKCERHPEADTLYGKP